VKVERMLKRSRRMVNKFGGYCVCCGEWVESGEGWIPHPYPVDEPTPLHCPECWEWFDAIDRQLSASADIPDQANENKGRT
jgi:hypothetical protein